MRIEQAQEAVCQQGTLLLLQPLEEKLSIILGRCCTPHLARGYSPCAQTVEARTAFFRHPTRFAAVILPRGCILGGALRGRALWGVLCPLCAQDGLLWILQARRDGFTSRWLHRAADPPPAPLSRPGAIQPLIRPPCVAPGGMPGDGGGRGVPAAPAPLLSPLGTELTSPLSVLCAVPSSPTFHSAVSCQAFSARVG